MEYSNEDHYQEQEPLELLAIGRNQNLSVQGLWFLSADFVGPNM